MPKSNLKSCGIPFAELESCALDRSLWRRGAIYTFESNRLDQLKEKRQRRKLQPTAAAAGFICDICRRTCDSRIELFANRRIHRWWDSSYQRFIPYTVRFHTASNLRIWSMVVWVIGRCSTRRVYAKAHPRSVRTYCDRRTPTNMLLYFSPSQGTLRPKSGIITMGI